MFSFRYFVALAIALTSPAHAGEAHGTMTLGGTTIDLHVANAFAAAGLDGKPFKVVVLTEAPIDLSAAIDSPNPYITLLNLASLEAVTHAMVVIGEERVSVHGHKAADNTQYLATRKFGLEAKVSGGESKPLEGSLRSTNAEMTVQIDVTFKAEVLKPRT